MADEIRNLRQEDIDQHLALSQFAFQYEIDQSDLAGARERADLSQIYGYYVNGMLASNLHLLPLSVYVHGRRFAMGGIGGVATWPEHRRGGKVAALLRHALHVMHQNGQTVSMLAPFSFAFYRRFGWEHCIDRKVYTLDRVDWPVFEEATGSIVRVHDVSRLVPVYDAYARRYSGMLDRSDKWWQDTILRHAARTDVMALFQNEYGDAEGYVRYRIKKQELNVQEFVALNRNAKRGLWNFLRQHDSMANQIRMNVPIDDTLPFLLGNPRIKQEVQPYFMARIVDVPKFLAQTRFSEAAIGSRLNVRVSDDAANWNNGTASFVVGDGGQVINAQWEPSRQGEFMDETLGNTLVCDIQTLSAMLMGYQRPTVLADVGRLQGNGDVVRAWESAIPLTTTYLGDSF